MKAKAEYYVAALYMRLSKDDGIGESASITTQRKMLMTYAKEYSYQVYDTYIDDGYSGTNFNRPEFIRMINDINKKKVNLVITKDLSRLGRDYIMTGQYTEIFFPLNGVRYIAINDGFDSQSSYNDIAPFKNVVNEMYARDISKKIRSAFATKMEEGSFIGNFAPYGYKKDPNNKNHLIIDDEVADTVREIFNLAKIGQKPKEIANDLNRRKVLTPVMYRCKVNPYLDIDHYTKRKEWTSSTISKMLHNIVYLGHMAQGKTSKLSLKSDQLINNSKKDWIIVKNTHEPIISTMIFDEVSWHCSCRKYNTSGNFHNIFQGIAKCMDCGRNMSTTGTRKKGALANLVCGGYKLYGKKECTNHFVDYSTLCQYVLKELREHIKCLEEVKKKMYIEINNEINQENKNTCLKQKKKIAMIKAKITELDYRIQKLYEDNLSGKISDERFIKLSNAYELEQEKLKEESKDELNEKLTNKINDKETSRVHWWSEDKFNGIWNRYIEVEELTIEVLHNWIERIEISQAVSADDNGEKMQEIRIYYKF